MRGFEAFENNDWDSRLELYTSFCGSTRIGFSDDSYTDPSFTTYNSAGTATGCVNTALSIPPNGMTTFGISAQCGITSGFGGAQIAHDGPPGAVIANITTFSASSGLSFDAAFAQRQKNIPVN